MVDPDGLYGMPRDVAETFLVYGDVDEIAARLHAYGDAGAARVVVTFVAGDWHRQTELLARAAGLGEKLVVGSARSGCRQTDLGSNDREWAIR